MDCPFYLSTLRLRRFAFGFSFLGLLLSGVHLFGQAPTYRPPPPPTKNGTFEVRLRYMLAPDVEFRGLGNIPLADSYETGNDPFAGTSRTILYDDGYLAQDYVESGLLDGGSALEPSNDSSATANFGYQNSDQPQNDANGDPTQLLFHRYSADGDADTIFTANAANSLGWELNYTRYFNSRRRLGVQVGFSFNGFDSSFRDEVTSDLIVQEFVHEMANGDNVPELSTDSDGNLTGDPFSGPVVQNEDGSDPKVNWDTSSEEETIVLDGAAVRSEMELRSSIYSFRAGPTYSLALGQRFNFNLGAGVSAVYYSATFGAYEFLQLADETMGPARGLARTDSSNWQVGGYLDASANYNVTQRVSLFSGLQFQSGSGYNQANEEREVDVDYSSQVYVHAGLGIKF